MREQQADERHAIYKHSELASRVLCRREQVRRVVPFRTRSSRVASYAAMEANSFFGTKNNMCCSMGNPSVRSAVTRLTAPTGLIDIVFVLAAQTANACPARLEFTDREAHLQFVRAFSLVRVCTSLRCCEHFRAACEPLCKQKQPQKLSLSAAR